MAFVPNTDRDRGEMLREIGVSTFEDLLEAIPGELRLRDPLDLPGPLSEYEASRAVGELARASRGAGSMVTFLGAGAYDHFVPSVVGHVIGRSEFYTAYTPYQAEVSQGTLQTIFEYQTLICRLTGMDVTNASVYDGGSALAEASLMACAARKHRGRIVCSGGIHPHHRQILRTYHSGIGTEIVEVPLAGGVTDPAALASALEEETAVVLLQSPNFLGNLEDVAAAVQAAHERGALLVLSVNPISLGILKPPGEYDVDIAVGDGQPLGNGLSFGGPSFGFFAARKEFVRRLPGRIVGLTEDREGRRGFVLTLQTREQHIRREKATSNICTNQALNALAATVYLGWLGESGIREVAELCTRKAHYARDAIVALDGFEPLFDAPFFHEFAVRTPVPAAGIVDALAERGFLAGLDLGRTDLGIEDGLLVAVTEKRTRGEIDRFVELLGGFSGGKG
jgi:glycine dehydrogenase subunit 1